MNQEIVNSLKRLWSSVFLKAVEDAWSQNALDRDGARAWINSARTDLTSFYGLCLVFDFDPVRTRHQILGSRTAVAELRSRVARQNRLRASQSQ